MLTGIAFGLGAATGFGLSDVLTAIGGRRLGSLVFVALSQSTSLVFLVLGGLLFVGDLPLDSPGLPAAVGLGILSGLSYLAFARALRLGPISVVSPVVSAYGGFTVVAAVILLGEVLNSLQALGAAVATIGILMVGVKFTSDVRSTRLVGPGVPFAVAALVGFGFLTVGLANPIATHGVFAVLLGLRTANTATAWAGVAVAGAWAWRKPEDGRPSRTIDAPEPVDSDLHASSGGSSVVASIAPALVLVIATAVCDLLGFICYTVGIREAETWLVGLVSSFGPGIAVLVAVGLLGERLGTIQWAGLATIVAGLALVSQS